MTSLMGFDTWWLVLVGTLSFLLNSVACILAIVHQKRKADLLFRESQQGLRRRIHKLEEDAAHFQREQSDLWSEIRNTIARLEFRSHGASERMQRHSMVGLDKKHQVCSLARKGLATEEISKKLNLYMGETELVLGLKNFGARTELNDARTSLQ